MAYLLILKPGAEEDIEHAYNWYEDQQEGLGEQFLSELVSYYKKLELHPTSYRHVILQRFPYIIVFEFNKAEVIIYAVFHKSRHPANKLRRK